MWFTFFDDGAPAARRLGQHIQPRKAIFLRSAMPVLGRMSALHASMREWRHDFHTHPELSLEEERTSQKVRDLLASFGVDEIHHSLARTGVVGVIRGRAGDGAVGLRADMDGLPISEATALPYASRRPGVMHACGHDGHTAMLLGAAAYLARTRAFAGIVYLIFQPAEEDGDGADLMVRDGLFDQFPMEHVFGLHNWPSHPAGHFFWRDGPIMAAAAQIDITVLGKGAHAAHPDRGVDPILAAAHIVTALQSLVARKIDPVDGGVVSICKIEGGDAYNVIPDAVRLKGSARWFTDAVGETLRAGIHDVTTNVAMALGAQANVSFRQTCGATINDMQATVLARTAAECVAGPSSVHYLDKPSMGAEDFASMLKRKAGSCIILGAGRDAETPQLHNPRYDFNDAILPIGAAYWVTLAQNILRATNDPVRKSIAGLA
jgi:hippurate hydrolase